jgi:hypothetical protein
VAAASLAAAAFVGLPSAGASGFNGSFRSAAAADGIRTTLIAPGVTVVKSLVDVGSTSTQATLNNLGESRSFASIPYPGDLVIVGPGTVAGATNGQINLPNYPLYAWTDCPNQKDHVVGDGPMEMRAKCTDLSSSAIATAGVRTDGIGSLGLSRTSSAILSEGEAVTAEATAEISSFTIGPLEIAQVVSVAEAVFDSSGKLERTADTRIVGVSVAGTPIQLSPAGVNAAGSASPPPDLKPLNETLKPAGFHVELVPVQQTDTGVVAPAVRITQQLQEGTQIIYQLGSAAASVEGSAEPAGASPDEIDTGDGGTDVTGPDTAPPGPDGSTPAGSPEQGAPGTAAAPSAPPAEPASDPSASEIAITPGEAPSSAFSAAPPAVPSYPYPSAGTSTVSPPDSASSAPPAPSDATADQSASPRLDSSSGGGDDSREVAATPVLASRLLDGGDSRPFYAAFVVAAIVGLAAVAGVALFSRALRSGV